ncbi:MAG TPA: aromatic ring-hydroxylating dioxygenase subunit alpha [Kofleriaceae bacterium]
MEPATHRRLIELLSQPQASPAFAIAADRYRDPARCEREKPLFAAPRVLAAGSAIAPGSCVPIELPDRSLILTRDTDGELRAFANACRHRATRLVDAPRDAKALVCPYHGWTYDLRGTLMHVPHAETFGAACVRRDLHRVAVAERHGLVWLGGDIAGYLGGLDADFAALGLERSIAYRSSRLTRRCNWKLVIEAFLDGYHIRVLHRDSIYRFFLDALSVAEPVGPHVRAVTARRRLRDATGPLHELATPSYVLFPGTVVIEHPDFLSILTLTPFAADLTEWDHLMLVPAERAAETEHWDASWALIEDTVFQREDLWVCEQIQRGIAAGQTEELLFGALESAVRWFHATLDARLEH